MSVTTQNNDEASRVQALILVPTRELAQQVTTFIKSAVKYCEGVVTALNVASGKSRSVLH